MYNLIEHVYVSLEVSLNTMKPFKAFEDCDSVTLFLLDVNIHLCVSSIFLLLDTHGGLFLLELLPSNKDF